MNWTVKRLSDGKYLYSSHIYVCERAFARRFHSEKQANAYVRDNGLLRTDHITEPLSDDEAEMLKKELNDLVQQNFYTK